MQTGDLRTVIELIMREDGTPCALGNTLELPTKEAKKLVEAGTHKYSDQPLGFVSEKIIKKSEEVKQEA